MRTTPRSRSNGLRNAALALSLFFPVATVSSTAAATTPSFAFAMAQKKKKTKKKKKEPENKLTAAQAEEARAAVRERADGMSEDPGAAGSMLSDEARKLGDPVLFIEAGDAYRAAGAADREIEPVESAIGEAKIALDILYFLQDPRADPNWEIVAEMEVQDLISRAKTLIDDSEALIDEIEAEQAPPPPPETDDEKTPRPKDGRGFIAAGSLLTVVGVGGLGMMGAGLAMGSAAQKEVEDPTVTGDAFDEADAKGKRANVISYAGIGVAAVGLISGVALLAIGVKKRKAYRADNDETASVRLTPALGPAMTGLSLSGRF